LPWDCQERLFREYQVVPCLYVNVMSKKLIEELKVIADYPSRRPYAAKISLILDKGLDYGFDGETSLLLEIPYIVKIRPEETTGVSEQVKYQKLTATIEGFQKAKEAEQMGLKLSLALLWTSISKKWPIKLEYHTPWPSIVFDRTQNSSGFKLSGEMNLKIRANPNIIADLIKEVISSAKDIDQKLLVSMELFASARLETTERAKFIGLVTALESLVTQEPYNNDDVEKLVSLFTDSIEKAENIPGRIKESLKGRVSSLKKESVSQAIVRFVRQYFPDNPEIIKLVKESYNIRSSILHEGTFDADLEEKGSLLEDIIRYIYSQILGIELKT